MKKLIFKIVFVICPVGLTVSCKEYKPTFGICTNLSDYPSVLQAGYTCIEPSVESFLAPAESDSVFLLHLEEQKRLHAKLISCNVFLPSRMRITGLGTTHDEIMAWAETAFSRAQKAAIPFIVLGSGGVRRYPENFSKEEATQQFISLCKRLGPLAQKYDVTVVIEPLNSAETNLINSLKEGAEFVAAVNHPNIQLLCDIFHMLREDEPAAEIVKYSRYIKHCHIAEKEKRSAPGTYGEDFSTYFEALKKINYTGCICIEGNFDDFDTRIVSALQYMRKY